MCPPSHPFYWDIQEVANAGVTTGCGGGKYCPDDTVTRGQMAAFMNRLGALGEGKPPVVNADKLDGLQASDFYTKAQVNSLPGAHVIAVGFVDIDGSKLTKYANLGCWTVSRSRTGFLPGQSPRSGARLCWISGPDPVVHLPQLAGSLDGRRGQLCSGDVDYHFATETAGVPTDAAFTFSIYGNAAPAVAVSGASKAPAPTGPAGATRCTIDGGGEVSCK